MLHGNGSPSISQSATRFPSILTEESLAIPNSASLDLREIVTALARAPEALEQQALIGRIEGAALNGASVTTAILQGLAEVIPARQFAGIVSKFLRHNPTGFEAVYCYYLSLHPGELRAELHRVILNALVNSPTSARSLPARFFEGRDLSPALQVLACPLGHRQGFGVHTDFYLTSRLALDAVGQVASLPLPEPFPKPRSLRPSQIEAVDAVRSTSLGYESGVQFGRSARLQLRGTKGDRFWYVFKGPHNPHCSRPHVEPRQIDQLGYEARVMRYLARWRDFFELESEIPLPSLGVRDRTQAWRFKDGTFLHYSASAKYFEYLEDCASLSEFMEGLSRSLRDLGRLARFGIFHTELAPVFHSIAQGRPYLWNVGGMAPGAGRLLDWTNAFRYANVRVSGIADFEHLVRVRRPHAVIAITHDGLHPTAQSLQTLLGNAPFVAFHLAGLWCLHHKQFEYATVNAVISEILKACYFGYTGAEWKNLHRDVDLHACTTEFIQHFSSSPGSVDLEAQRRSRTDLGQGCYPMQSLIGATTAFTIRAIERFVKNRRALLMSLPSDPTPNQQSYADRLTTESASKPTPPPLTEGIERLELFQCCAQRGIAPDRLLQIFLAIRGRGVGLQSQGCRLQIAAVRLDEFSRALKRQLGASAAKSVLASIFVDGKGGVLVPLSTMLDSGGADTIWLS